MLLLWHFAGCTRLWPIRLWPSLFSRFGQFDFGQNKLFQLFARLRLKEICSTGAKILPSPHPPVFRGGQTQFMQGWSPEGWGSRRRVGFLKCACTFQGPGASKTPPIFHERTSKREKEERKLWRERSFFFKKKRNFGRSLRRGGPGEGEGVSGRGKGGPDTTPPPPPPPPPGV